MSSSPAELLMRGPLLGILVGMLLYGIMCMQAFLYFQNYPDDRLCIKLVVLIVWCLETIHAVLSMNSLDYYLIQHFSNTEVLNSVHWEIPIAFIIEAVAAWIIELYYAWRIWKFSSKNYIPVILCVTATARLGLGITASILAYFLGSWSAAQGENVNPRVLIASIVLGTAGDGLGASAFAYFLHTSRSDIPSTRTDHLINRLLIYIVGTGVAAFLVDVSVIITYLSSSSLAFLGFSFVLVKVYAVSLMISLNIRNAHSKILTNSSIGEVSLPRFQTTTAHSIPNTVYPLDVPHHTEGEKDTTQVVIDIC